MSVKVHVAVATVSTSSYASQDSVPSLLFKVPSGCDDFSVDNDFTTSNYDAVKTTLSLNNFVTTFEFLETKNYIGNESYISNETQYSFNETNRLKFGTRKKCKYWANVG